MKKLFVGLLTASCMNIPVAEAQELGIEITNLTNAIYLTPLLVSAHNTDTRLFQSGEAASANLQAMAEGGNISGLEAELSASGANNAVNPAGGLLAPGKTTSTRLSTDKHNTRLSVVAMLLPTNDGFAGLNAVKIPKKRGTYTYYVNGYDAGTEVNDEIINGGGDPGVPGIPIDPGSHNGSGASGVTSTEHNKKVHVHRGTLGDMNLIGGISDLDSSVHHWLNPVVKIVVTVNRGRHHEDED